MWAGIGAALSFIAVMWPAWRSNRATVVRYARASSRPQDRPAFQRYYLDLVVVGIGALLFFQLQQSGSLVTEDLFGGLDQDPLLLIAPAVFVVTVAVLFLRLFPLLLRGVAWITGRLGGASLQIALWHLTRAPLQPGRLALLLIMATSLGMFGGTFGATLSRSFDDRASYEAGAPIRLADIRASGASAEMLRDDVRGLPGVAAAAPVARANASSSRGQFNVLHAAVLAVDPDEFGGALWYRRDFAEQDIDSLFQRIQPPDFEIPEIIIPAEATRVGLWFHIPEGRSTLSPSIRVEDGLGRFRDVELQGMPPGSGFASVAPREGGWRFLRGELRAGTEPGAGPWRVHAISLRPAGSLQWRGAVVYDQLSYSVSGEQPGELHELAPYLSPVVEDPAAEPLGFTDGVVVEDFETAGRWHVFTESRRAPLPDSARLSPVRSIDGGRALSYRWTQRLGSAPRGVRLAGPEDPIPVLASASYLVEAGLQVGDEASISTAGTFLPIRIAGAFDLFPSWYPDGGRALIVADRDYLFYRVNRNPSSTHAYAPSEVWLDVPDPDDLPALRAALAESVPWRFDLYDAAEIRRLQDEDPLVAAGWEGLLFITFIAIVILSALGFLVASILVAQQQAGEFAVLRTMGFSLPQVLIVVGVEKLLIIAVSMALGTFVGLQLGVLMLEFVGFDVTGEGPRPALRRGHRLGHHRRRLRRARARLPRRHRDHRRALHADGDRSGPPHRRRLSRLRDLPAPAVPHRRRPRRLRDQLPPAPGSRDRGRRGRDLALAEGRPQPRAGPGPDQQQHEEDRARHGQQDPHADEVRNQPVREDHHRHDPAREHRVQAHHPPPHRVRHHRLDHRARQRHEHRLARTGQRRPRDRDREARRQADESAA